MQSFKRCPNGTRKNPLTGKCETKQDIAVKKFCEIAVSHSEKCKQNFTLTRKFS